MPDGAVRTLRPAFGLRFEDLYHRDGLLRLDTAFIDWLRQRDAGLADALLRARADTLTDSHAEAPLLLALAPVLDSFVGVLFGIDEAVAALKTAHLALAPLIRVKWKVVKRKALLSHTPDSLHDFDADAALRAIVKDLGQPFDEVAFAQALLDWQHTADDPAAQQRLHRALRYCAWATLTDAGRRRHPDSVLFNHPVDTDPLARLPALDASVADGVRIHRIRPEDIRRREGMALTDAGASLAGAIDQANYCLWCHRQRNDSCAKGLRAPAADDGAPRWRNDAFGLPLAGCPLEERISEFHALKAQGHAIGALATILIENPMVAATGHRICNDCMRACVFQQQTPVDIPQTETRTLKDVLGLPWGFEIYSLLTRWNPLNLRRPLPAPPSGRKVLVAGMGPAGFTLAHHLLNDGHAVVGIDGLKIEPLPPALSGVTPDGSRIGFEPVADIAGLLAPLDERLVGGFGGVAEYGITARWDKNFLTLIRLLLERRDSFALCGGVRFGSTLDVTDSFALGFDHIALAMGAGRPTMLDIPNGLARGVRAASDFLMALQLGAAARADSLTNLQVRLPVVVIGGGLTAIDTATEALAYYPVQVEKFLRRYETLAIRDGEAAVRAAWSADEAVVADEFIGHARAIRAARAQAARDGHPAPVLELLQAWGGVTVAYRRRLIDSPGYIRNHEEVGRALAEGVRFAECVSPVGIATDDSGAIRAIRLYREPVAAGDDRTEPGTVEWPARALFIAAGTHANTVLAREDAGHFRLDGRYFQAIDETGAPVPPSPSRDKPAQARVLVSRIDDGRLVSCFGDMHPNGAGNVVRAMGSARQGAPVISGALARRAPARDETFDRFAARIQQLLRARIERVVRLAPDIVEVVVHAPQAARRFQPGQFYRLQNFESLARTVTIDQTRTRLATEGLALTGAWVDRDAGLVGLIVLEMGGSSNLCAGLTPGEPVSLMGPTGMPTEIRAAETVLLAGGGLGNAVLFSIGAAFRALGSRVLYFAGYRRAIDRYRVADIEAAADVVVWCCDEAPGFTPTRPGDLAFHGNLVAALTHYARNGFGAQPIALAAVDRVIAIGSDRMMAAVAKARHGPLAQFLKPGHHAIGSINSPMQCMMKEICAQCLQTLRDPVTGVTHQVFSCHAQDQSLDAIDFAVLDQRLRQNAVQEKLTARWIRHCLLRAEIDKIS